jgi:membrane-bound lytic murein transglycosylase B
MMLAGNGQAKPIADWSRSACAMRKAAPCPTSAPPNSFCPPARRGRPSSSTPNFRAIERYNTADAYVIAIGHLSDRLERGPPSAPHGPVKTAP